MSIISSILCDQVDLPPGATSVDTRCFLGLSPPRVWRHDTLYFVDERFGYGTVEEFARGSRERERFMRGKLYRRHIKRPLDAVASMVGLVLLSPLFLVLAILVKLDSRGPVFFKQIRVGKGGREFEFYKSVCP